MLSDRETVGDNYRVAVDAIRAEPSKAQQQAEERTKEQINEWGKKAQEISLGYVQKHPDAFKHIGVQEIPANADAKTKAALEASNALAKSALDAIQGDFRAVHSGDPKRGAELIMRAHHADYLETSLKDKTAALEKAESRISELESDLAKVKKVGSATTSPQSTVETAPKGGGKKGPADLGKTPKEVPPDFSGLA